MGLSRPQRQKILASPLPLEADLTQGAVPVLWSDEPPSVPPGWYPVLQVADVTDVPAGTALQPAPARYGLLLSDGVNSQHAMLTPAVDHLASGGALRRGSVVRLLSFVSLPVPGPARTIFILQLEILQTECALIGSLKLYKPPRNSGVLSISRSMKLSSVELLEKTPVWTLVGQIKDKNLGYSDKPDVITVKATISRVTELQYRVTCPLVVNGKQCNGKATGDVGGIWLCDRCGDTFLDPKYWCSVRIQIQDHTGTAWATAYEEAAEKILGCTAKDLYSMKYKQGDIILSAVGKD